MSIKYLKLSDLPIKKQISDTDLFIYSTEVDSTHLSTRVISYPHILKTVENNFVSLNRKFKPKGEWNFTYNNNNNCLFILKESINEISSVVTYEFAKDNYLDEYLTLLSTQLYGNDDNKRKLPSYVGQILISHDIRNETLLKKIYGQDTIWELIPGRFLLGAGPNQANTDNTFGKCTAGTVNLMIGRAGGQNVVNIPQIPKHSHKFVNSNFNKFPVIEEYGFGLEGGGEFNCVVAGESKVAYGRHHHHWTGQKSRGSYLTTKTPDIPLENASKIESKSYSFTAHGTILENESSEKAHNNMPPFVVEYIWERKL